MKKEVKKQLLQKWSKITGKKLVIKKDLKEKELATILYQHLKSILDETINLLGIKLDQNLIRKINKISDFQRKADYQKKLIESLVAQFKEFSLEDEGFLPKDIQKVKKFNCAGGSLLFNRLLEKAKIKNYYGFAFRHVVNIAELANGSFLYICTRANLKGAVDYKKYIKDRFKGNIVVIDNKPIKDVKTGIKYLILSHKEIPYRLILLLSPKASILSIIDNLETLNVRNLLFPKVYKFERENELWKKEEKRLSAPEFKKILKNRYTVLEVNEK